MKKWWLRLVVLSAAGAGYFRFYPPPHFVNSTDPLRAEQRFRITFRTFPTCDIYVHHPDSSESFGEPVGRSNSPVYLKDAGPQGTQIYYVYSGRAREIIASHPTDWHEREQLEIPSENLRQKDLSWDGWPPSYFPRFLLTSPSAWATFGRECLVYWRWILGGLFGVGLYGWQTHRDRQLAQEKASQTQVGEYTLGLSLGKGGSGEVFRALRANHKPVALKILLASAHSNPELHKRFQTEVKVWRQLNHPHIVSLLDWGQQNDVLYLVMELLEGESLGQRLRREGKLSHRDFLELLGPLTSALQCLHDKDLVHRDLKPDNIFLRQQGGPALMDFGIATGGDMTRATQTGSAVGTPTFMAPEQLRGHFGAATDQYALGVVSFVCLTGKRPFEADDPATMAYLHATAPVPRASALAPELPAAVDSVIAKMLAKSPGDRYASVAEAARALSDALTERSFLDEGTIASST